MHRGRLQNYKKFHRDLVGQLLERDADPEKFEEHLKAMPATTLLKVDPRLFFRLRIGSPLYHNGYLRSLEQVCRETDESLSHTYNIGPKAIEEIKIRLADFGLSLADDQ